MKRLELVIGAFVLLVRLARGGHDPRLLPLQ